jgi:hypothetical protein
LVKFLGGKKSYKDHFPVTSSLDAAAIRNKALIVFGKVFSERYFTKKLPPSELPIKIMSLFRKVKKRSNQIFHS